LKKVDRRRTPSRAAGDQLTSAKMSSGCRSCQALERGNIRSVALRQPRQHALATDASSGAWIEIVVPA
jgi:hypothetical protein